MPRPPSNTPAGPPPGPMCAGAAHPGPPAPTRLMSAAELFVRLRSSTAALTVAVPRPPVVVGRHRLAARIGSTSEAAPPTGDVAGSRQDNGGGPTEAPMVSGRVSAQVSVVSPRHRPPT